jgi:hypothetical protein
LTEPLLDWLQVEYGIAKPGTKLLALPNWAPRPRSANRSASGAGRSRLPLPPPSRDFCFLLSQFQLFSTPARALAAEALTLKRTLSDLVNHAYGPTPAEIALMWQTAPSRIPILLPTS